MREAARDSHEEPSQEASLSQIAKIAVLLRRWSPPHPPGVPAVSAGCADVTGGADTNPWAAVEARGQPRGGPRGVSLLD